MNKILYVVDVEGDGLLPTKLWCLSANKVGTEPIHTTASYDSMRKLLLREDVVIIGHNFMRWDAVHLERLLGIKVKATLIDTLALSWYLEPKRPKHGLEDYGVEFGYPKVVITDWENQTQEDYEGRCHRDVEINRILWDNQWAQLVELYEGEEQAWRFIHYLMFKMDCAREQEASRWKLDVPRCKAGLVELTGLKEAKVVELATVMPQVAVWKVKSYPAKPFKQDGSKSASRIKWDEFCVAQGKPIGYRGDIDFIHSYKDPNPNSHDQVKAWLFSFGWEPGWYKYVRNKETGEVRTIPQVKDEHIKGEVCHSVKALFVKETKLEVLNGLSILTNRISTLKGYLDNVDEEGYIQAQIQGLTNTLRFIHKVVLNLPGIDKPYGELMRGCLIAPDGYELCGADMSSLEDRTKQHYMFPYDPEYVKSMMVDDFDPHIDLAEFAGAMSPEDAHSFKNPTEEFKHTELYDALKAVRKSYKATNYACVYGAGGPTVARGAGVSEREGFDLVTAYWKRNWSVKRIAKDQHFKECLDGLWLYNPVSRFWYSLRHEKDIFSTLNQGTGVYCFDMWIKHFRKRRPQLTGQMHDEVILCIKKGFREGCTSLLRNAIIATNKELGLNRDLDIDVQFGDNYSEIH